jgi:hypothetical protein
MHRLRCGVIYTNAFADYIAKVASPADAARVLALDYVAVSQGETKKAWWHMDWMPVAKADDTCRFKIGDVLVYLSKQCQRGLKHRCLDWRDGQVVVRS